MGHAEVRIGDTVIMLADEHPDHDAHGPRKFGGSPVGLHMYVEEVDAVAQRAIAAGTKVVRPVADQFYGDRNATLEDRARWDCIQLLTPGLVTIMLSSSH